MSAQKSPPGRAPPLFETERNYATLSNLSRDAVLNRRVAGRRVLGCFAAAQRMTKGLAGTSCAVEIQTLFVSRYSRTASIPLSRPIPECFIPPNGIM
jgi:hypothetical protein